MSATEHRKARPGSRTAAPRLMVLVALLATLGLTLGVVPTLASHRVKKVFLHTGESVRCPRGGHPCRITVRGEARAPSPGRHRRARGRGAGRMVRIGRARLRIAPGASRTLTFRLNRTGARLVLGHRHLSVRLIVAVRRGSRRPIVLSHQIVVAGQKRH